MRSSTEPSTKPAPDPVTPPVVPRKRSLKWLGSLITIWLAIVLAAWFALHRPFSIEVPFVPFSPEVPLAIGRSFAAIGLLGLILLASGAIGTLLLNLLIQPATLTKLERLVFSVGLGLGLNGFALLGLGLIGLLNQPVAYILLFVELLSLLIIVNPQSLQLATRSPFNKLEVGSIKSESTTDNRQPTTDNPSQLPTLCLWFYIGIVSFLTLLIALAPPIAWDAQLYHLTGPKIYIEAGRILPERDLVFMNYPFSVEMLYTWGMLLLNDSLAQIIHWAYGIAEAVAIYAFARRFFAENSRTAWLAAALYLSVPSVQILMGWAYTDLAVTFYGFLALYAVLIAFKLNPPEGRRFMIVAGLYFGLAFGGKYTAVLIGPGLLTLIIMAGVSPEVPLAKFDKFEWKKTANWLICFGVSAFALMLPWLIRNFFFSDNPIAPLLFGARGWDKNELAHYVGNVGAGNFSPLQLLGLPISLVLEGTTGAKYDATLNPLFLAFAPLIVLVIWREWRTLGAKELFLATGIYYLCWLVTVLNSPLETQARMLMPVFPMLALLTAYAIGRLPRLNLGVLRPAASLALAFYLGLNTLNLSLSFVAFNPLPVLTGLQNREAFLEENLGSYYRAARFVSQSLPAQAYVHMFFEPRTYYFNRKAAPDVNLTQFSFYFEYYPTAEAFNAILKQRGATHIFISERGERYLLTTPQYGQVDLLTKAQPLFSELKSKYWKEVYREPGEYAIYEVK